MWDTITSKQDVSSLISARRGHGKIAIMHIVLRVTCTLQAFMLGFTQHASWHEVHNRLTHRCRRAARRLQSGRTRGGRRCRTALRAPRRPTRSAAVESAAPWRRLRCGDGRPLTHRTLSSPCCCVSQTKLPSVTVVQRNKGCPA